MKTKKVFNPIRKISIDEEAHIAMNNYNAGKVAGIKEVVDWIENNRSVLYYLNKPQAPNNICKFEVKGKQWQAKLKEWGLTEGGRLKVS